MKMQSFESHKKQDDKIICNRLILGLYAYRMNACKIMCVIKGVLLVDKRVPEEFNEKKTKLKNDKRLK